MYPIYILPICFLMFPFPGIRIHGSNTAPSLINCLEVMRGWYGIGFSHCSQRSIWGALWLLLDILHPLSKSVIFKYVFLSQSLSLLLLNLLLKWNLFGSPIHEINKTVVVLVEPDMGEAESHPSPSEAIWKSTVFIHVISKIL